MNNAPAVSVIVPTHNYGRFIKEALESVRRQSFRDYEVWVMDDGSTDDTPEVVKSFQSSFGERLIYVRSEKNRGVYTIRNEALKAAQGRFIAFLDADDIWEESLLADLTGHLEGHPEDLMVYANVRFFYDRDKKELGTQFGAGSLKIPHAGSCATELFLEGNFIPFMTTVLRREVFERAGLFDETLQVGGDYDLFMKIACLGSIGYVDRVLCCVRRHERNLSFLPLVQAQTQPRIAKKALRFFSEKGLRLNPTKVNARWAQVYYELGAALVLEGHARRGRKFILRSWKLEPAPFKRKVFLYLFLSFIGGGIFAKGLRTKFHILREKWRIRNR